ncbi:MAG: primosomal protein N' [Rickettsiales bacterium]|nr:primosomal protein N' [Rickettsiales bacterium]
MQIIKVVIPHAGLFPLEYSSHQKHIIGELVVVPFRSKQVTGIVWEVNCKQSMGNLKHVLEGEDAAILLDASTIEMMRKAANYYMVELGTIAKLVLPVDVNQNLKNKIEHKIDISQLLLPKLSSEQEIALKKIEESDKPILIKGVTGSGKTEVYFYSVLSALKRNKQVLIMLPEIALSKQIINRFEQRFGFKPAVWNSAISASKKKSILRGIIDNSVKVVIGARSALFLPYRALDVIVVDEEHDSSYKQFEGVLYNARDMAVLKGQLCGCKVILSSATPSIESYYNSLIGKYQLVDLSSRFNASTLPEVKIVDMRNEKLARNHWLSEIVVNEISDNVSRGLQTLIFLNRKGYAPLVLCRSCGHKIGCKYCSASMVLHKEKSRLQCHHCGHIMPNPKMCPSCNDHNNLVLCGPGIERIEEEVRAIFPKARTASISKDQFKSDDQSDADMLEQMEKGEIDILIGTQVITKGYHFSKLSLVIVVDADIGFIGGDLRATERTFQLLNQVSGRAGREGTRGKVVIQTLIPEHKVIDSFVKNDEKKFFSEELESRKKTSMPPYSKAAVITVTGKNAAKTKDISKQILMVAPKSSARILGPTEAMMYKLSGKYRYKILVISEKNFNLQKFLKLWLEQINIPTYFKLKIDIDPQNLW